MNKTEGIFLTIEGGEGSGKTTIAEQLTKTLSDRGYSVLHTREPGGTKLSEQIRNILLKHSSSDLSMGVHAELLLFLAARAQNIEENILPQLRKGGLVLCERFHDSSVAYQGAARYLGMQYVEQLCHLACPGIEPHCTLLLDLDPRVGLERAKKLRGQELDRLEEEGLQFHSEVRQGFLHQADKYPSRIRVIDAGLSLDQVLKASLLAIEPFLLKPTHRK